MLQAFDESDLLLLVANLDVPALKSLKITAETLGLLNHPKDRWRLVLNRADMKVGLTPAEVEKTLDMKIDCLDPAVERRADRRSTTASRSCSKARGTRCRRRSSGSPSTASRDAPPVDGAEPADEPRAADSQARRPAS